MADWNPTLYRRFEDERTRPAAELLTRVPLDAPRWVFDLGCGPGNSTELLVHRFPQADVIGVDNSEAMLKAARERLPDVKFESSDIADWTPAVEPQLLYSNATLQWLPQHERLLPRLFETLAPGGVLALQMPDNLDEPSHRLMRETAADGQWHDALDAAEQSRRALLSAEGYYDLLAPYASMVDVWRTTYHHLMASPADIVQWVRSTALKPFLDALSADQQPTFLAQYERRLDQAYPQRADGRRLLAFPRLFIVAQRRCVSSLP
ncbi:MAG TPA: trans-aconitate 2-methyltransferase [Burkholderiaceae bacterium]|nr:trans-aconitate 2-methyltransferase [Burkholderiaceae bacterium]